MDKSCVPPSCSKNKEDSRGICQGQTEALKFCSWEVKGFGSFDSDVLLGQARSRLPKGYLLWNPFLLRCDARALKYLQDTKFSNARIFRWSIWLGPFTFRIEHIPGSQNPADFGSRFIEFEEAQLTQTIAHPTFGIKRKDSESGDGWWWLKERSSCFRLP